MSLKRNISKTNLLFLSISSIIGSGWLFGSFYTAQVAGPSAIFSWFVGGIFIAIIALTLAELTTMFPLSGGISTVASFSHGKFCGALFSWITWIWSMAVAPIEVQAVMQYSSQYFPSILTPVTENLTFKGYLIATVLMFVLCFINLAGVKIMAQTNKYISVWKILIPIFISMILVFYRPHYENLTSHSFAPLGMEGFFGAISTGGVAFSFFGFQTAIFLAGEAKNPQKSIPFSLFGSVLVCTLIYAFLQFGFVLGLDPKTLNEGWAKLHFLGSSGPFAGILLSLGFFGVAKVLYADAMVSPLGTALGYVAASSRILYSMGLERSAPRLVSKLNKNSVPWVSIMINFIFGMIFFLPFSGWKQMASFISAAVVVSLVCGPVSLPVFRDKYPEKERPFKLPYGKFISFLSFYLCTLILYWTGFQTIAKLEFCVGAILVFFGIKYAISPQMRAENFQFKSSIWFIVYLVLCGILSYFGTFGNGIGLLNMKQSCLGILVICFLVNKLSNATALSSFEIKSNYKKMLIEHQENKLDETFVKKEDELQCAV